MTVRQYINVEFETSTVRTQQYITFERQCKKELKAILKPYGINLHKFLGNHFEWSAVLEREGNFVYVHISDVRWWDWYNDVLIRTMEHDSDWHGGSNHKCTFAEIGKYADSLLSK